MTKEELLMRLNNIEWNDFEVKILKSNPKASRAFISKELNISQSNVQFHLNRLKQDGLIHRVGSDRGGYWEVSI